MGKGSSSSSTTRHFQGLKFFHRRLEPFPVAAVLRIGRMETIMADSEEKWIRQRAYALWEEEGYPSGKDQEHWDRARSEYAALGSSASSGASKGKKGAAAPKATKAAGAKSPASKTSPSDGAASKKSTAKSAASTVDAALGEAPSGDTPKAGRSKSSAKTASSAKSSASEKKTAPAKAGSKNQAAMPEAVEPVKKRSKKVSAGASS
jgi:hypothetical protein